MSVDCDLRDHSRSKLVGALNLQRGRAGLYFQTARQRRRDQRGGDLLVHLDDALAEQILDQVKDRAAVTLQQPADGRELAVDIDLGPAYRQIAAFGVTEAAHSEPLPAPGDPPAR